MISWFLLVPVQVLALVSLLVSLLVSFLVSSFFAFFAQEKDSVSS